MKLIRLLILFLIGTYAFQSCNIVNPAEPIATYVHIDSFSFQQTPNIGTSSHKITSVWVYYEGKTIGAFPLPCNVPIITSKSGLLMVRPGITVDGVADIQSPYFQYNNDTITIPAKPSETINFQPKTSYIADTLLNIVNQDFESGNPFQKVDGDTGILVTSQSNYVYEGNYSGLLTLDSQQFAVNLLQTGFTTKFNPFVEINYKNTIPFVVGLQTTNAQGQIVLQYLAGFNPKSEWNKVYVSLVDFVNQYPNKQYFLVIRAYNSSNTQGYVALDNVKILSVK